jgi:hypothetical protein
LNSFEVVDKKLPKRIKMDFTGRVLFNNKTGILEVDSSMVLNELTIFLKKNKDYNVKIIVYYNILMPKYFWQGGYRAMYIKDYLLDKGIDSLKVKDDFKYKKEKEPFPKYPRVEVYLKSIK